MPREPHRRRIRGLAVGQGLALFRLHLRADKRGPLLIPDPLPVCSRTALRHYFHLVAVEPVEPVINPNLLHNQTSDKP
jgi:hypothetical protein